MSESKSKERKKKEYIYYNIPFLGNVRAYQEIMFT